MITGDFDGTAEALYRFAGFKTTTQPPLLALVERLMGDGAVRTVPAGVLRSYGALVRVGTNWRVFLSADCSKLRKRFVLLHELSHWALGPEASEDVCDRLAGALLLPRAAYLNAKPTPAAIARVSREFGSDDSCSWLRFGETIGEADGKAIALTTATVIRKRGTAHEWPSDAEVRRLAELVRPMGYRKSRVSDDHSRVVLRAG